MKSSLTKSLVLLLFFTPAFLVTSFAEQDKPNQAKKEANADPKQEALEKKFIETLTNATMAGRWCLIRDGKLTPEKEDKYTIEGVYKAKNGSWVVKSRIQYGNFDMTLPVAVKVEWAGDTPVIIVDNMGIPGGNKYSARVVIHNDSYAGTWSGGNVKGLMSGMITRKAPEEGATKSKEEAKPDKDKES